MRIIDVHTHAFPDSLANKAISGLVKFSGPYQPFTDGTISGLLSSMDKAGISASFILNIATKPAQAESIRKWCLKIKSERIFPLGSVHPFSENAVKEVESFYNSGIKGIKLHPMYQNFAINDKRVFPVYETIGKLNMFVIIHAGYDLAFPTNENSSIDKINDVLTNFPKLRLVAAHFGGWKKWREVYSSLCGKNIYFDTSFIREVPPELRKKIFMSHDRNKFLFGTDCPWDNQKFVVDFINNVPEIDSEFKEYVFYKNADNLMNS